MQLHLNTYGLYLHVKDDMFEVKNTNENTVNHIAAHKVKSIYTHKGMSLSTDAIILALKNNIDIVLMDWNDKPVGRFWHTKLGSTTKIRKKQLECSLNERALYYTKSWLLRKIDNQSTFINSLIKHRPKYKDYLIEQVQRIEIYGHKIRTINADDIDAVAPTIRGMEGNAGRAYFESLFYCLKPYYDISIRSFRPAQDSFNAMLNYAYAILYSKVEKALIIAGLDPFCGFLHRDDYNYKSLVYDYIEPYRVYAEVTVFRLFAAKKVRQDHVEVKGNGVAINSDGKKMLVVRLNKYLIEDKIRYKNRNTTRENIIQLDAHEFAQEILGL